MSKTQQKSANGESAVQEAPAKEVKCVFTLSTTNGDELKRKFYGIPDVQATVEEMLKKYTPSEIEEFRFKFNH